MRCTSVMAVASLAVDFWKDCTAAAVAPCTCHVVTYSCHTTNSPRTTPTVSMVCPTPLMTSTDTGVRRRFAGAAVSSGSVGAATPGGTGRVGWVEAGPGVSEVLATGW